MAFLGFWVLGLNYNSSPCFPALLPLERYDPHWFSWEAEGQEISSSVTASRWWGCVVLTYWKQCSSHPSYPNEMETSQFCFDTGLKPTGKTVGVWQLLTFWGPFTVWVPKFLRRTEIKLQLYWWLLGLKCSISRVRHVVPLLPSAIVIRAFKTLMLPFVP